VANLIYSHSLLAVVGPLGSCFIDRLTVSGETACNTFKGFGQSAQVEVSTVSRIFLKIDKDPPFLLSQSNIDTLVAIKLSVQKQLSLCLCDCVVLFFDQYWFTEDGDGWGDGDGW